ncbi:MAG: hypothetical protein FWF44_10140 [Defluviitaleaceae bacterium]|nr:hypothetical protein [Defluviitaleaceae bacterium]
MTTVEWGAAVSVFSLAIAFLTYSAGRQGEAKSDSAGMAGIKKDVEYIKRDIAELKELLKEQARADAEFRKSVYERIEAGAAENGENFRRLGERIDEHLREEHDLVLLPIKHG